MKGGFSDFGKKEAPATSSIISINILSILLPKEYFCVFGIFSWHSCQSLYADFIFSKTGKSLGGGLLFEE